MIEIKQGDYVKVTDRGEPFRKEVIAAFMNAGCPEGEGYDYSDIEWDNVGWDRDGIFNSTGNPKDVGFIREVSLNDIKMYNATKHLLSVEVDDVKSLPEIGSEVEVHVSDNTYWEPCTIIAHDGDKAVYRDLAGNYDAATANKFRSVNTDREDAVEAMMDIVYKSYANSDTNIPSATLSDEDTMFYMGVLYDAGYVKHPDNVKTVDTICRIC